MTTFIITGVSKGLGESLAQQVLKPGNTVVSLSRRENVKLSQQAEESGVTYFFYPCDLNQPNEIIDVTAKIIKDFTFSESGKIVLINNAGVVEPIKRIGQADALELAQNIQVNLTAPLLLSNWFLQAFASVPAEKIIVNVSSGAAQHPYDGWVAYCSSKAGMDMLTRAVALEQEQVDHPAKVISFSPGVMDTEMQGQIRSSDQAHFSNVEAFRDYKEKGLLRSTEIVANKLLDLLETDFESGRIYSIQELM